MSEQFGIPGLSQPGQSPQGKVECLGRTFENDEARRAYFLAKLREKLHDPEFRKIEGFPIGEDDDILALSDPPYYTACPNPFLEELIQHFQDRYTQSQLDDLIEPFVADITEGKNEHYYSVHTYHTKVPYRAIARFILHYTKPGHIILDGFCGTGMTGLAVQSCSNQKFVKELDPHTPSSLIGERLTVLSDLSPAATHIAINYNAHTDSAKFKAECKKILNEFQKECGWMFRTLDPDSHLEAPVDYYVWSDIFSCPECGYEIVFWDQGVDQDTGYKSSNKDITCPSCRAENHRDRYERVEEVYYDDILGGTAKRQKEKLVLIVYRVGKKQKQKTPDDFDLSLLERINREQILDPIPVVKMLNRDGVWGDMYRAGYHLGITHFHHFYYRRTLRAIAWLWKRVNAAPSSLIPRLRWWLQSVGIGHTRLNRYFASSYSQVNRYLKGFLYIAQVRSEVAPWYSLNGKVEKMAKAVPGQAPVAISTSSATRILLQDNSVDYIFTDPPFGGNIIYSELNFMWEAWFRVFTNQTSEAIVSGIQGKDLELYQDLMELSFSEYYRVLKPGRWITILFHNSKNAVWISIQNALEKAGFVVADVRVFDKQQLTMKQQTAAGTVQKDLIITAYRPNKDFEQRFTITIGSEEGVWEFIQTHLQQLPIFIEKNNEAEIIAERQARLLFDRMIAFYLRQKVGAPISAAEFYLGLSQRFPERDGMYFLPEQVAEYDRRRMTVREILQLELFVTDESTAVQWVRQQLIKKPQTFKELQPNYMRETTAGWSKHEKSLDLKNDILDQYFLCYEGNGLIPPQIVAWLTKSSIYREKIHQVRGSDDLETGLVTDDLELISAAKDRWYVPDTRQEADLIKLRERALLRVFDEYCHFKQKQLKVFRLEAVKVGFAKAWRDKSYQIIVDVGNKIPEAVLQEDPKLLMYYDQAVTRVGEDE